MLLELNVFINDKKRAPENLIIMKDISPRTEKKRKFGMKKFEQKQQQTMKINVIKS